MVSHYSTPTKDFQTLTPEQRRQEGGTGPCAFIDPQGALVPQELDRIEYICRGYEAALTAGCLTFARCRHDNDAFRNAPAKAEFSSPIYLNQFALFVQVEALLVTCGRCPQQDSNLRHTVSEM